MEALKVGAFTSNMTNFSTIMTSAFEGLMLIWWIRTVGYFVLSCSGRIRSIVMLVFMGRSWLFVIMGWSGLMLVVV